MPLGLEEEEHEKLSQLRIVVLVNREEVTTPRYLVLASTDLTLEGRKLVELSVAWFQIEFLFRDGTQFTGLTHCQPRAEPVLDFHFHVALATLNLGRTEKRWGQTERKPHVFSIASWTQRHFNERLLDLFIDTLTLDPRWIKIIPAMRTSELTALLLPDSCPNYCSQKHGIFN